MEGEPGISNPSSSSPLRASIPMVDFIKKVASKANERDFGRVRETVGLMSQETDNAYESPKGTRRIGLPLLRMKTWAKSIDPS
jgi:hypothetical protein